METILTLCLVSMAGLIAFSQYFTYANNAVSEKSRIRYMFLAFSITGSAAVSVVLQLTYPGRVCYLFYALGKFFNALTMCEIMMLTEDMVGVEKKYTSVFISLISYSSVAMFFVDTAMRGGRLDRSPFGVFLHPEVSWHQALYFVYYMFYVVMLITFAIYRSANIYRRCERHDLYLLLLVYMLSGAGYITEQFLIAYSMPYIPFSILFNLAAVFIMRRLLIYHDSITLSPGHYQKELDESRTDVIFILDDKLKIVYQNKRAEVLSKLFDDEYVGRKITDVFTFSQGAYSQICQTDDENAFGISADYPVNGRHVNMIINHKLDNYREILSTAVFVYNMEDAEKAENLVNDVSEENEQEMIRNAVNITKDARVLIIDEDIVFLNVFQRILKPYQVNITRAVSGKDALEQIGSHTYDIIFVAYEMEKMSGAEIVSEVRRMNGEYYSRVPIVFTTTADINDVFTGFLEAGFNDYLEKPISKRALNSVLTRWLWQRLENEDNRDNNRFSAHYNELNELITDAEHFFNEGSQILLGFCLKGIERDSRILGLNDITDLSSELNEALMFEDSDKTARLFVKLRAGIRDALTIR